MFFRTANLVSNSLDTFSSHLVFSWGSIKFTSSGTLLTVTRTKTLAVPVPNIPGSPLPYVYAPATISDSLHSHHIPYLHLHNHLNQLDCITAKSLNTSIKHLASLLYLESQNFSSQSMSWRSIFKCGIPAELIKLQRDWWSNPNPNLMLASGGQTCTFKQCFPAVPYRDNLWTHIYFVLCYRFSFPS